MTWCARFLFGYSLVTLVACGDAEGPAGADTTDQQAAPSSDESGVTYRSDVKAIRRAQDALPAVVIPPFENCQDPLPGEPAGEGPNGQVCTNVSIAGCTEEGRYFPDYASCDVVLTQRPYWEAPPANVPTSDDPRLGDAKFMQELAWVTEQIEASGCTCCHDSRQRTASQWDIAAGLIWTDTISNRGLSLFAGLSDSQALGAYPEEENHGFDRMTVGIPTTDIERMRTFFLNEISRRGISDAEARAVRPFGGPVYLALTTPAEPCTMGEGVREDGTIDWGKNPARYVYILEKGSKNPGVPPNLDLPVGTVWRLDVLASQDSLESGSLRYGTTPKGSFQAFPEKTKAPALEKGKTYQLTALYDTGLVSAQCLFNYPVD